MGWLASLHKKGGGAHEYIRSDFLDVEFWNTFGCTDLLFEKVGNKSTKITAPVLPDVLGSYINQ